MKLSGVLFILCILLTSSQLGIAQTAQKPVDDISSLNWKFGPATDEISNFATLSYGKEHIFLGSDHTNKALELMGNLPSTRERYLVAKERLQWFAVFEFINDGYVKDDEKIDADALLENMMDGNKKGNEERKKKGMQTLELVGWSVPPHYNSETKRLEWGTKLRNEDGTYTLNYTSRLLGRSGYMTAILVSGAETFEQDVAEYNDLLEQFSFVSGEKYSEFSKGDRVAEYGIAALVAGGAAAAVMKSKGLWKIIGLAIIAAFAAVVAFFKNLFKRR
jgi:uncharacterized membrane-anchored protein